MTTCIKNSHPLAAELVPGMVTAMKAVNAALATPKVHVDSGALGADEYLVAGTTDGTLPTLIAVTREILACYLIHTRDTNPRGATGSAAHKVVDETLSSAITVASIVDLATVYTALNAIATNKATHMASTTYHYTADAANAATSAAAATTQGTADTLATELKADFNAHIALALGDLPILQSL
jgi:hypothetical protein